MMGIELRQMPLKCRSDCRLHIRYATEAKRVQRKKRERYKTKKKKKNERAGEKVR